MNSAASAASGGGMDIAKSVFTASQIPCAPHTIGAVPAVSSYVGFPMLPTIFADGVDFRNRPLKLCGAV
jgi:hypothetical protein